MVVALLTAAAFALRLSQLHQSLFGDEVLAYREIAGHSLTGVVHAVRSGVESSPPLFFVLAWISAKLGDPTVWIRLPSLILGTATVPVIYLLGRETVGRPGGAIAAALFAISPFSLYYGVEARPYGTLAFFCVLSTYALVRATRTRRWGWWVAYAVAAAAAAYSHYTAVFVLGVQGAWSLWACRDRLRQPLGAAVLALALYAPWLPEVHGTALGVYGLFEPRTLHNVTIDLIRLVPGYPYASLRAIPTHLGRAVFGAAVLVGIASAAWRLRRAWPLRIEEWLGAQTLILALALATPVGVLIYSVVGTDIWDARNLYASVPAITLTLGALLAAIPVRPRALALIAALAVLLLGSVRAVSSHYSRPAYRTAAQYLDRIAAPRDPIVMYSWDLTLDQAVAVQLHKPHWLIRGAPRHWPSPPRGGSLYLVIDDAVPVLLKTTVPHPAGLELVSRREYRGLVSFSLITYRPLRGA